MTLLAAGVALAGCHPAAKPADAFTPPRLLARAAPGYATDRDVYAVLAFTVTPDGRASDVEIVNTNDADFAAAATLTVLGLWTFEPARRDGQAVAARVRQRLEYRRPRDEDGPYPGDGPAEWPPVPRPPPEPVR